MAPGRARLRPGVSQALRRRQRGPGPGRTADRRATHRLRSYHPTSPRLRHPAHAEPPRAGGDPLADAAADPAGLRRRMVGRSLVRAALRRSPVARTARESVRRDAAHGLGQREGLGGDPPPAPGSLLRADARNRTAHRRRGDPRSTLGDCGMDGHSSVVLRRGSRRARPGVRRTPLVHPAPGGPQRQHEASGPRAVHANEASTVPA